MRGALNNSSWVLIRSRWSFWHWTETKARPGAMFRGTSTGFYRLLSKAAAGRKAV